jgi:hypothetical protein
MSDETDENSQIHENNLEGPLGLWVDDLRPKPESGRWHWAKNYNDAIVFLESYTYDVVSLDHDLNDFHMQSMNDGGEIDYDLPRGRQEKTGYHVALWMVEQNVFPPTVRVHTMNPVGGQNICQLLRRYHPGGAGCVLRVAPF